MLTKQDLKKLEELFSKGFMKGLMQFWDEILEPKFNDIDKRFDSIDKRFETIDKRFEVVDKRFVSADKKLDALATKEYVDAKLVIFEADLNS